MRVYLLIGLIVSSMLCCQAQSSADGRIDAHAYVNTYLHFTYAWPATLQPVDIASLNVHSAQPSPNEFPLFAARQGQSPFGIVMIAEKLHIPTPHNPTGFKDGADFLRHLAPGLPPEAHFKILNTRHVTTPAGLLVDELDYSAYNEFDSGIAILFGQYIVVFKCNAASLADLDAMTKSVRATRRTR